MRDGFMSPAIAGSQGNPLRPKHTQTAEPPHRHRVAAPPCPLPSVAPPSVNAARAAITTRSGLDACRHPSFAPGGSGEGERKEEASDAI
jgi:hypothetical protein